MSYSDKIKSGMNQGQAAFESYGIALLVLIPATVAVGAALTAMLGPVGWVIAAVGATVGAFVGMEQAHQQLRKEIMDAEFFNNGGLKIAAFTDTVVAAIAPINDHALAVIAMKSSIDQSIASYQQTNVEVASLIGQLGSMGIVTQESVDQVLTASQNLYDQSLVIFTDQQIMLQTHVIDMMKSAGETSNSVFGKMLNDLYLFQADGNVYLAGIQKELGTTSLSMTDMEPGSDAFLVARDKVEKLRQQMYDFTTATSDTDYAWQDAMDTFNEGKLDFTSIDDATRETERLGEAGTTAIQNVKDSSNTILEQIDADMKRASQMGTDIAPFEAIKQATITDRDANIGEITAVMEAANGYVAEQFQTTYDSAFQTALANTTGWENFLASPMNPANWFNKCGKGYDPASEANRIATEKVDELYGEVETALTTQSKELGIEPSLAAGKEIADALASGM
ncbi:MAG: hypothetical protein RSC68_29785, partial [Acinetobacter sp.]